MPKTVHGESKVEQLNIVEKFARALANYRVELIEPMLTEDGEYTYFELDASIESDGNKAQFLQYLSRECAPLKYTASKPATIEFDQCLFCKLGNPVILLNGGKFPHDGQTFLDREKLGLMLEFEGDMICGVTFCGTFVKQENNYNCDQLC